MKTDELISALAADASPRAPTVGSALTIALGVGGLVMLALFAVTMGPRPDLSAALGSWRFVAKVVLAGLAVAAAAADCLSLSRPTAHGRPMRYASLVVLLLVLAVAVELAAVPREQWLTRLVGTNAWKCLLSIPLFAAAPFAAILYAMRAGAPASPTYAGLAAGVLAAACGAVVYATHCFDDSPLFVAVWYPLALLAVGLAGALAGRAILRW